MMSTDNIDWDLGGRKFFFSFSNELVTVEGEGADQDRRSGICLSQYLPPCPSLLSREKASQELSWRRPMPWPSTRISRAEDTAMLKKNSTLALSFTTIASDTTKRC